MLMGHWLYFLAGWGAFFVTPMQSVTDHPLHLPCVLKTEQFLSKTGFADSAEVVRDNRLHPLLPLT